MCAFSPTPGHPSPSHTQIRFGGPRGWGTESSKCSCLSCEQAPPLRFSFLDLFFNLRVLVCLPVCICAMCTPVARAWGAGLMVLDGVTTRGPSLAAQGERQGVEPALSASYF